MAQSGKTAKIAAGATVRRLKKQARTAGIAAAFFPAVCLAGSFFLSGPGRIAFAAGTAAAIIACLIFCGKFAASARRIVKEAEKYSFALTEAFFFECFGPFLLGTIEGRCGKGGLGFFSESATWKPGRIFLWRSPIAARTSALSSSAGRPGKKIGEKIPKREKEGTKTLAKGKKIVYNKP